MAALALHDALFKLAEGQGLLSLKWPNDVLLSEGKVAGILLEASGQVLCIGIGVNLTSAPPKEEVEPGATIPVSVVGELGLRLTPETLLDALATAYEAREQEFRSFGFAATRQEWLDRAARLGEKVRARSGTEVREGVFESIDLDGNLILGTGAGSVAIPAAEVFF